MNRLDPQEIFQLFKKYDVRPAMGTWSPQFNAICVMALITLDEVGPAEYLEMLKKYLKRDTITYRDLNMQIVPPMRYVSNTRGLHRDYVTGFLLSWDANGNEEREEHLKRHMEATARGKDISLAETWVDPHFLQGREDGLATRSLLGMDLFEISPEERELSHREVSLVELERWS